MEKLALVEKEKDNKGTHDLGFMLYCSFGNAYRLMGDTPFRSVLLTGAESMISRFDPEVACIRDWDHNRDKWPFPVIIDNMMNLQFLSWASKVSGYNYSMNISPTNYTTTIKYHSRPIERKPCR